MDMLSNADKIKEKLTPLAPLRIEVTDESARHASHAGHSGGDMTHLTLAVTSAAFAGKSRLQRQRMVMDLVAPLFKTTNLHALSVHTFTPEDAPA